jgi:hypothetical protein
MKHQKCMMKKSLAASAIALALYSAASCLTHAQTPPSATEAATYVGLHAAAQSGDVKTIRKLASAGADLETRDGNERTPLHVAAFVSYEAALEALAAAGADMNALDGYAYDAVTIAAVANDKDMLRAALKAGNKATNVTSRWDGTALIAAAHLGHHEVVRILIDAGAPLDHVNNLGWTAAIEAVVLGDGGENHQRTLDHLIEAGADLAIADRGGNTPLDLARSRGYIRMAALIEAAGGKQ